MGTDKVETKLFLQISIMLAYPKSSEGAETYPWQTHHQWKLLHFCSSYSISPCNWSNALQNWGSERMKGCLGITKRLTNFTRHCHTCYYGLVTKYLNTTLIWQDLSKKAPVQREHSPGGAQWCRSSASACSLGCGTREQRHPSAFWSTLFPLQSSGWGHWAQSPAACKGWAMGYLVLLKVPLLIHLWG